MGLIANFNDLGHINQTKQFALKTDMKPSWAEPLKSCTFKAAIENGTRKGTRTLDLGVTHVGTRKNGSHNGIRLSSKIILNKLFDDCFHNIIV